MSGRGVRRMTVEVDLVKFESDLSVGGYHGLGRSVADKVAPYALPTGAGSDGLSYGLRVISDDRNDDGSVTKPISPFMVFCLGALSATAIILIGVAV